MRAVAAPSAATGARAAGPDLGDDGAARRDVHCARRLDAVVPDGGDRLLPRGVERGRGAVLPVTVYADAGARRAEEDCSRSSAATVRRAGARDTSFPHRVEQREPSFGVARLGVRWTGPVGDYHSRERATTRTAGRGERCTRRSCRHPRRGRQKCRCCRWQVGWPASRVPPARYHRTRRSRLASA